MTGFEALVMVAALALCALLLDLFEYFQPPKPETEEAT